MCCPLRELPSPPRGRAIAGVGADRRYEAGSDLVTPLRPTPWVLPNTFVLLPARVCAAASSLLFAQPRLGPAPATVPRFLLAPPLVLSLGRLLFVARPP